MTNLLDEVIDEPRLDPSKNYVEELVGEDKKFKSVADLARGKYESDLYIQTLERQKDALREDYLKLREDYNARAKLEEILDQMKNQNNIDDAGTNSVENNVTPPPDLDSLFDTKLQQYEVRKKQEENLRLAQKTLREKLGDNYQSTIKQRISELDLDESYIEDLARKSPKALFKTLGIDQPKQESFQPPMRSSQRNDNFAPTVEKRTWSYYEKIRKANPTEYWNPKTQVQMHNDAIVLGDSFDDA
jgi:hypothetical protein